MYFRNPSPRFQHLWARESPIVLQFPATTSDSPGTAPQASSTKTLEASNPSVAETSGRQDTPLSSLPTDDTSITIGPTGTQQSSSPVSTVTSDTSSISASPTSKHITPPDDGSPGLPGATASSPDPTSSSEHTVDTTSSLPDDTATASQTSTTSAPSNGISVAASDLPVTSPNPAPVTSSPITTTRSASNTIPSLFHLSTLPLTRDQPSHKQSTSSTLPTGSSSLAPESSTRGLGTISSSGPLDSVTSAPTVSSILDPPTVSIVSPARPTTESFVTPARPSAGATSDPGDFPSTGGGNGVSGATVTVLPATNTSMLPSQSSDTSAPTTAAGTISAHHSKHTAMIVGICVAVVLGLGSSAILLCVWRRRKRKRAIASLRRNITSGRESVARLRYSTPSMTSPGDWEKDADPGPPMLAFRSSSGTYDFPLPPGCERETSYASQATNSLTLLIPSRDPFRAPNRYSATSEDSTPLPSSTYLDPAVVPADWTDAWNQPRASSVFMRTEER